MTDAKNPEVKKRPSVKARGRVAKRAGEQAPAQGAVDSAAVTQPIAKVSAVTPAPARAGRGDRAGRDGRVPQEAAPPRDEGASVTEHVWSQLREEGAREARPSASRPSARTARTAEADGRDGEGSGRRPRAAAPKKPLVPVWLKALLLVLALTIVAAGAMFSWDRWLRYDDAADFRGTWYVAGSSTPITVGESTVELTPDVTYEYELDTRAKTITFSFSDLSGEGRYRFSADRTQVAVIEGTGYDWLTTFSDDLAYTVQCAVSAISGKPAPALGEGDAAVVLQRQASSGADVAAGETGGAAAAGEGGGTGVGGSAAGAAGAADAADGGETPAAPDVSDAA